MSKKILRTALIGAGGIGRGYHLRNITTNDGFELAAIVDVKQETLDALKEKYDVPMYTSLTEMLAEVKPDLCVIASPTPLHVPQTIECMEAGCDVFLEKPIGMSRAEGEKLKARRDELGRKVMVYQPHRCRSETLAAEQIIASGKLGPIFMIKRNYTQYFLRDHWQGFKKNGGGNLANHGAHYLDQVIHLSGGTPVEAYAVLTPIITTGDADDVAKAVIRTDNGVTLDVDINFVDAMPVNEIEIFGKYGKASYGKNAEGKDVYHLRYYDPAEHDGNTKEFPFKEEDFNVYDIPMLDFYEKCYELFALDMPQFVPIEETLTVMGTIDMCRTASGQYKEYGF